MKEYGNDGASEPRMAAAIHCPVSKTASRQLIRFSIVISHVLSINAYICMSVRYVIVSEGRKGSGKEGWSQKVSSPVK